VWHLKGTTLKGIMTATPWVILFFLTLGWILFDEAMYMAFICNLIRFIISYYIRLIICFV